MNDFLSLTVLTVSFTLFCCAAHGAESEPKLILDLPAIDYPFNWSDGYTFPSMKQSLNVTKDFYEYTHFKLAQHFQNNPQWGIVSIAAFDVLSDWLPLGSSWLHEEWHRAVLSNRKISSYDDIYNFKLFSESIAVSHVTDEDLIRLKHDHPTDFVRLSEAGIEAQYELNFALEKDHFFFNSQSKDTVLLYLNYLNNINYLLVCASPQANSLTDQYNREDGSNISKRDFTGLDCTAWVYDLFRPDEPYQARGTHPSGTGIDRYIKYSDLSSEEKHYLKLQRNLSLINLLDPFLINYRGFNAFSPFNHKPLRWNLTARHELTSFGYTIDANLFIKQAQTNLLFILHNYVNDRRMFPGLEMELLRRPATILNKHLYLTSRGMLWFQPDKQKFMTSKPEPGGLAAIKMNIPASKSVETYVELEAKTNGWVAGNVYLEKNFSVRMGITALVF